MKTEIVVFGIMLLVIGLGASLYAEKHVVSPSMNFYGYIIPEVSYTEYPYRDLGEILVIIAIPLATIGLVISSPPKESPDKAFLNVLKSLTLLPTR